MLPVVVWIVAAVATACIIIRPFRWPDAVWPCLGGLILLVLGQLNIGDVFAAIGKGTDVYLFLIGMMLLSEVARRQGLFDWVAAIAVNHARQSPKRLFLLLYVVGTVTTVFLSNDATAVVLTPAVYAATRAARVKPLPYLFGCAFIANAASFVLPISNPANIVLYGDHTPSLLAWLASFALPSLAAIVATYVMLYVVERKNLDEACAADIALPPLTGPAKTTLAAIGVTAAVLMTASAFDVPLGAPTLIMGLLTAGCGLITQRQAPWPLLKGVSWSVLPLVAGLFVLVAAVEKTGLILMMTDWIKTSLHTAPQATPFGLGMGIALASNLTNNLPAGLIAATAIQSGHLPKMAVDSLLIGVDLGPNVSVTGSLATLLWLQAIRREGQDVGFWRFLKVGCAVTPLALLLALGARLLMNI